MTALDTRPADLRLVARNLTSAGQELNGLATQLLAARSSVAGSWTGLAAMGQAAATEQLVQALRQTNEPLEGMARTVEAFAARAEESRATVQEWQRRQAEANAERLRQIGLLHQATDPGLIATIKARIEELEHRLRWAQEEIARAEDWLEQGARILERVLGEAWAGIDLDDLVRAGKDLVPVWRGGGLVIVGTRILLTVAHLGRELSPVLQVTLGKRLERLLWVVRKPGIVGFLIRLPYQVLIPLTVIRTAWPDLRDGGGYDGWQGFTLRVTATLAIPGSVAMVFPHPVVAGVGAVAVGSYYLVKGGLAVYNNPEVLIAIGRTIARRRNVIIDLARRAFGPTAGLPLGPLGPIGPLLRPGEALSDLPKLSELGKYLPSFGRLMPIIQLPIEAGPRLPAIPPVATSPVGAGGLILPKLIRLF